MHHLETLWQHTWADSLSCWRQESTRAIMALFKFCVRHRVAQNGRLAREKQPAIHPSWLQEAQCMRTCRHRVAGASRPARFAHAPTGWAHASMAVADGPVVARGVESMPGAGRSSRRQESGRSSGRVCGR